MVRKARVTEIYQVNLYCDTCGNRMERDNIVLTAYPPIFQYFCRVCGNRTTSRQQYPYQIVEFDENNSVPITKEEEMPNTVISVCNNDSIIDVVK